MGGVFLVNTPSPNRALAQTHNLFFARQKWFLTLCDIRLNLTDFCPPFFDIRFYSSEIRSTLFEFPDLPAERSGLHDPLTLSRNTRLINYG
jgi:hypothetical protein